MGLLLSKFLHNAMSFYILEEHIEEVDFLWQQWTKALGSRSYALDRLAELEERLLAHLDGLVLGGQEAWKLLEPKLTEGDRGESFAAAFVALDSEHDGAVSLICDRLGTAAPSIRAGIRDAFCHASYARIESMLRNLLQSDRPADQSAAIDILSFRRVSLERNDLRAFLRDNNVEVMRAALLAIARLRMTHLEGNIRPLLISDSMVLRQEAIKASLVVGIDSALNEARQIVQKAPDQAGEMLILLGDAGQVRDLPLLIDAIEEPALARSAITTLGLLGYVDAMPRLIQSLEDRNLARLAGEAMQLITGLDVEKEGLAAGSAFLQQHDGEDEFEEDPDDALPWPDPAMVSAWWTAQRPKFDTRTRYRYGHPHSATVLLDSLKNATLPHRHHAALELALLNPNFPFIETRAFAHTQRNEIGKLYGSDVPL